jgi:uncharacterized protein YkwD
VRAGRVVAAFAIASLALPAAVRGDSLDEAERLAALEWQLFEAVNGYRSSEGLAPLALDDTVADLARRHSRAMAEGRVGFGHAGMRERAMAIGAGVPLVSMGENVARHRRALQEVRAAALTGWIESDAHRRNLLGDRTLSGIGAARSPSGEIFLTQIFVGTRAEPEAGP